MVRIVNKLSPLKVAKLTAPGLYGDGNNLYLQIAPSGAKSWSFRFTLKGRPREMGLGPVAVISLAEARARAIEARRLLLDGIDPIEHRNAQRAAKAVRGKSFALFDLRVETRSSACKINTSMRMREITPLREGGIIGYIKSRFAPADSPETPVIEVSSRRRLDALLTRYGSMRAELEGGHLAMWDGLDATHRNYEDQLGGRGWRLDVRRDGDDRFHVGYNVHDCTPDELKRSTLFQRLFTQHELQTMAFEANEV